MSKVIRISDKIYRRLEKHAVGFDSPNNVIEKLLDFYENNNKTIVKYNVKTNMPSRDYQKTRKIISHDKKERNPMNEKNLKRAVGNTLEWGGFSLRERSILDFGQKRVVCKYSSYSDDQGRWFWGVGKKYRSSWDETCYLALLMQNKDLVSYSFLLLDPYESVELFKKCSMSNDEKKINLRYYQKDGKIRLQEWQEFEVEEKIRKIPIDYIKKEC